METPLLKLIHGRDFAGDIFHASLALWPLASLPAWAANDGGAPLPADSNAVLGGANFAELCARSSDEVFKRKLNPRGANSFQPPVKPKGPRWSAACPHLNLEVPRLNRERLLTMAVNPESPLDKLWQEYATVFKEFDDLKLARWMAQTLGQIEGRAWRLSHPLLGAYRLAAQTANDRGLTVMRLATCPAAYTEAECCRAPLVPLLTRDVKESGLGCVHCGGTAVEFADIPEALGKLLAEWADEYAPVHAVAHAEDGKHKPLKRYHDKLEDAAQDAEQMLATAGRSLAPKLLDIYPTVIWEDQDECLEVRPEDIPV